MLFTIHNLEISSSESGGSCKWHLADSQAIPNITAPSFLLNYPIKTDLMLHLLLSRDTNGISWLYLATHMNETCRKGTLVVISYPQLIVV